MLVDFNVDFGLAEAAGTPRDFIQHLKDSGLDGAVLTAMAPGSSGGVSSKLKKEAKEAGVALFEGTRVQTNRGLLLCVLPEGQSLSKSIAQTSDGLWDAQAVIEFVESKGGASIALRPYDRELEKPMGDHLFSLRGLTACEVQDAKSSKTANELALEAAANMEMPCVGASSASDLNGIGLAATLLKSKIEDQAALIEILKRGDCWPVRISEEVPRADFRDNGHRGGDRRGPGGQGGRRGVGGRDNNHRGGGGGGHGGRGHRHGGGGRHSGPRDGGPRDGGRDGMHSRGPRGPVDDDYGNRVHSDRGDSMDDDVGNRLAPGEVSPLRSR